MGSPRQTFAGETRPTRQCRWPRAAEGRSASHFKIYPSLLEQPRPCLSAQARWRRRRRSTQRRSWDGLPPRNIYFDPAPPPPTPSPTPSPRLSICRQLSFEMNPSRKLKPSKKEMKTCSLPSLSEEQIYQQSVGFFKLSLVKTISPIPRCPPLSEEKREKALSKKYEKLVVSRPEDSSYFCTKLTEFS